MELSIVTTLYNSAPYLEEFHARAVVGVQSAAGYAEGMPLDTSW